MEAGHGSGPIITPFIQQVQKHRASRASLALQPTCVLGRARVGMCECVQVCKGNESLCDKLTSYDLWHVYACHLPATKKQTTNNSLITKNHESTAEPFQPILFATSVHQWMTVMYHGFIQFDDGFTKHLLGVVTENWLLVRVNKKWLFGSVKQRQSSSIGHRYKFPLPYHSSVLPTTNIHYWNR